MNSLLVFVGKKANVFGARCITGVQPKDVSQFVPVVVLEQTHSKL